MNEASSSVADCIHAKREREERGRRKGVKKGVWNEETHKLTTALSSFCALTNSFTTSSSSSELSLCD